MQRWRQTTFVVECETTAVLCIHCTFEPSDQCPDGCHWIANDASGLLEVAKEIKLLVYRGVTSELVRHTYSQYQLEGKRSAAWDFNFRFAHSLMTHA